jgi:DNA-directed RNA polymerase subunit RPC12/RpoP
MTSPTTPLRNAYDALCAACGDLDTIWLTTLQYRAMQPQRCQRCSGRVFVTPARSEFEPIHYAPRRAGPA